MLGVAGDGGWGRAVAERAARRRYGDDLVDALVELSRGKAPDPLPTWVTCVPSLPPPASSCRRSRRASRHACGLPFRPVVAKARETAPQAEMDNSAQQYPTSPARSRSSGPVPDGPVYLVDDTVDSRWTLTVIAALAPGGRRRAGVPARARAGAERADAVRSPDAFPEMDARRVRVRRRARGACSSQREAVRRAGYHDPAGHRRIDDRRAVRRRTGHRHHVDHRPAGEHTRRRPRPRARPTRRTHAGTSTHHITVDGLAARVRRAPAARPDGEHAARRRPPRRRVEHAAAGALHRLRHASPTRTASSSAYPNGVDAAIRQWNFLRPADIDFAEEVVHTLVRDACVDPAHAYAVGISSGSAMTASLACRASDTFAGFGLVAGDFYNETYLREGAATADHHLPRHRRPARAVQRRATSSHVRGLPVQPAKRRSRPRGRSTTAARRARRRTSLGSEVTRLAWNGCVAPVVLYRIEGGGHTWPGAIDVPRLGKTTKQISATAEMWKFFAAN